MINWESYAQQLEKTRAALLRRLPLAALIVSSVAVIFHALVGRTCPWIGVEALILGIAIWAGVVLYFLTAAMWAKRHTGAWSAERRKYPTR